MLLSNILSGTCTISLMIYLENILRDSYNNERNADKKLFLFIKNYLIYNIIWSGKPNIFFTKTKLQLYLNYEFFSSKNCILTYLSIQ